MKQNIIKSCLLPLSLLCAVPALAGDAPSTVIELFTSQGCSSCPPANEFVGKLADDADKLVLSYGVTYWDYLGWEDTFGKPQYTIRQKEYDRSFEIGHVYTPQIVLNGAAHDSRFTKTQVETQSPLTEGPVHVDIEATDGRLAVKSNADRVYIISYTPGWQNVAVKRGENGGRTLKVANVVTNLQILEAYGQTDINVDPDQAYAALVHDNETHEIIAASVLRP